MDLQRSYRQRIGQLYAGEILQFCAKLELSVTFVFQDTNGPPTILTSGGTVDQISETPSTWEYILGLGGARALTSHIIFLYMSHYVLLIKSTSMLYVFNSQPKFPHRHLQLLQEAVGNRIHIESNTENYQVLDIKDTFCGQYVLFFLLLGVHLGTTNGSEINATYRTLIPVDDPINLTLMTIFSVEYQIGAEFCENSVLPKFISFIRSM